MVGVDSVYSMGQNQRRYDKDHVMPHACINERVLHTFLH